VLNGIIVVPLLSYFTEATFLEAAVASVFLSVIAWFIGDQMILRISNHTVATVADAGLAFIYLWIVAYAFRWSLSIGELLLMVVLLGAVEWWFHRQLVLPERA
jgi:hypothetical protein